MMHLICCLALIGIAFAQYDAQYAATRGNEYQASRGNGIKHTANPWATIKRNRLRYRSTDAFANALANRIRSPETRSWGSDDFFYPSQSVVLK